MTENKVCNTPTSVPARLQPRIPYRENLVGKELVGKKIWSVKDLVTWPEFCHFFPTKSFYRLIFFPFYVLCVPFSFRFGGDFGIFPFVDMDSLTGVNIKLRFRRFNDGICLNFTELLSTSFVLECIGRVLDPRIKIPQHMTNHYTLFFYKNKAHLHP